MWMNSCPNQPDKLLPGMGINWNRCKSYPDRTISGVGKDSSNRNLFPVLKQAELFSSLPLDPKKTRRPCGLRVLFISEYNQYIGH